MSDHQKMIYIDNMVKNLPTLRAMLHISQADLAERIGVSRQQIVAIETGKRKITWTTFLALSFLFNESQETKLLLNVFNIYDSDLRNYLAGESHP